MIEVQDLIATNCPYYCCSCKIRKLRGSVVKCAISQLYLVTGKQGNAWGLRERKRGNQLILFVPLCVSEQAIVWIREERHRVGHCVRQTEMEIRRLGDLKGPGIPL